MKGSFFLLLFFLFFDLQSQTGLMSPYSRFGLGNLNEVVHPEFVSRESSLKPQKSKQILS